MALRGFPSIPLFLAASFFMASSAMGAPREEISTVNLSTLQISAPEAYQHIHAGTLKLIDIRTPEEWRQTGVAQGAVRINMLHPAGMRGFVDAVLKEVDGKADTPIALICRTGNRTSYMQQQLRAAGFTQIYNIKEGMMGSAAGPGWIRQGLPIEACPKC